MPLPRECYEPLLSPSLGYVPKATHGVEKNSASSMVPSNPSLPSRSLLPRLLAGNSDHTGATAPGCIELIPHIYRNSRTLGGKRWKSSLKCIRHPKESGLKTVEGIWFHTNFKGKRKRMNGKICICLSKSCYKIPQRRSWSFIPPLQLSRTTV